MPGLRCQLVFGSGLGSGFFYFQLYSHTGFINTKNTTLHVQYGDIPTRVMDCDLLLWHWIISRHQVKTSAWCIHVAHVEGDASWALCIINVYTSRRQKENFGHPDSSITAHEQDTIEKVQLRKL